MSNFFKVLEFHAKFGVPIADKPTVQISEQQIRVSFLLEEMSEYVKAVSENNIEEVADALADMLYIIYGSAAAHGIPIDSVFAEVHRSNLTKTGAGWGKAIKGPDYSPPDITEVLKPLNDEKMEE